MSFFSGHLFRPTIPRLRFLRRSFISTEASCPVNRFSERTHTCGQLSKDDVGKRVTLFGWVQYTRFNNKIIALRDSYGIIQCIVNPELLTKSLRKISIPNESVVKVEGCVIERPSGETNQKISTGDIEISTDHVEVLAHAKSNIPILTRDDPASQSTTLENRLKYRYLDIRRKSMQDALRLRSKMCHIIRNKLINLDFVECETPTLFNRTPGGANEYIVPTQEYGKFYSLVQSPQQLKQLLMIGGLDRYFQICRCYRDEVGRSDRQPEFTQVDIELSFTNQNLVMELIENLMHHLLTSLYNDVELTKSLTSSFNGEGSLQKIPFSEAFSKYGSDKPDTRFDWLIELHENDKLCIDIPFPLDLVRLQELQKNNYLNSSLVSYDLGDCRTKIITSNRSSEARKLLGTMRVLVAAELAKKGENIYNTDFEFLWITDFPLFTTNDEGRLEPNHHPFTAPSLDTMHLIQENPLQVIGQHYDLVLNGQEVAGGSIRINDAQLQGDIFKRVLGVHDDSFKYFLEALSCGCPPHGGIAIGLDRLTAILMKKDSIRDVIAFPKTSTGRDLMTESPQEISNDVKSLYHLSLSARS